MARRNEVPLRHLPHHDNLHGISRAVESQILALVARGLIVVVTTIVVPAGGYFAFRIMNSIESLPLKVEEVSSRLGAKIEELRGGLGNLEQAVKLGITQRVDHADETIRDHEMRLRALERPQPRVVLPPRSVTSLPAPPVR